MKMNNVQLSGRLTADPVVRYTQTNKAVCTFTLAVNRMKKDEADFIRCQAWEKQAELMQKYVHKGDRLIVEGSIRTGSYEKNGQKMYTTDVLANHIEFDIRKQDGGFTPAQEEIPPQFEDQEELPF